MRDGADQADRGKCRDARPTRCNRHRLRFGPSFWGQLIEAQEGRFRIAGSPQIHASRVGGSRAKFASNGLFGPFLGLMLLSVATMRKP
jgi:hypothetical protein